MGQDPAARILGCYSEPNWQTTIRSLYKLLGSSELPPGRLISSVQVIGGTEPQPIALVEAWTMATQLQRGGLAISSLSPRKLRSQALAIPKVGRTHQIQAGPLFRQQSHNRQSLSCPHSATRSRHSSCLIAKAWIGHCRLGQEHLRATGHPVLGDVRHADMPETLGTIPLRRVVVQSQRSQILRNRSWMVVVLIWQHLNLHNCFVVCQM